MAEHDMKKPNKQGLEPNYPYLNAGEDAFGEEIPKARDEYALTFDNDNQK